MDSTAVDIFVQVSTCKGEAFFQTVHVGGKFPVPESMGVSVSTSYCLIVLQTLFTSPALMKEFPTFLSTFGVRIPFHFCQCGRYEVVPTSFNLLFPDHS